MFISQMKLREKQNLENVRRIKYTFVVGAGIYKNCRDTFLTALLSTVCTLTTYTQKN